MRPGNARLSVAARVAAGLAVAALAALPISAAERHELEPHDGLKRGARVYVVAARDSRLFTLCPALDQMAAPFSIVPGRRLVTVAVYRGGLHLTDHQTNRATYDLPLPPGLGDAAGVLLDRVELDRERVAPDREMRTTRWSA